MTRETVIEVYLMNSPKVVAEMLYDTIERYENRTCASCKHFELDRFEDNRGTCRNKNTPTRNFMVDCDYGCNKYEPKENK